MNFLTALLDAAVGFVRRNPLTCLLILLLAVAAPAVLRGIAVFILYFVLGLIVLTIVVSFLFRWRIRRLQRQMEEQFGAQSDPETEGPFGRRNSFGGSAFGGGNPFGGRRREGASREGEVKVHKTAATPEKRVADHVGDYVEFEETKGEPEKQ